MYISLKIGSLDLQGCSLNEELREQKNLIDDFKKRIELIGTKYLIYGDIQIKNIQSSNIFSRNIEISLQRTLTQQQSLKHIRDSLNNCSGLFNTLDNLYVVLKNSLQHVEAFNSQAIKTLGKYKIIL